MANGFGKRKQRVSVDDPSDGVTGEIVEVVDFKGQNDNERISDQDWQLIQENGHLATVRLNELLKSKRFHRLRASEQARLIQLAQDRAFGRPDPGIKRSVSVTLSAGKDATAAVLNDLAVRAKLPEYRSAPISEPLSGGKAEKWDDIPDDP